MHCTPAPVDDRTRIIQRPCGIARPRAMPNIRAHARIPVSHESAHCVPIDTATESRIARRHHTAVVIRCRQEKTEGVVRGIWRGDIDLHDAERRQACDGARRVTINLAALTP